MEIQETLIRWSDIYIVGNETIDNQHKKLVDIINELYRVFNENYVENIYQDIIEKLVEYTKIHFSEEEQILQELNCDSLDAHKKQHLYFIEKLELLKDKAIKNKIFNEIMEFLGHWLISHILISDKKALIF